MIHGRCKTCRAPLIVLSSESLNGLVTGMTVYCPTCDKTELIHPAWPFWNYVIGFGCFVGGLVAGSALGLPFVISVPLALLAWLVVGRRLTERKQSALEAEGLTAWDDYAAAQPAAGMADLGERIDYQRQLDAANKELVNGAIGFVPTGGILAWVAFSGRLGEMWEELGFVAIGLPLFALGMLALIVHALLTLRRLEAGKPRAAPPI